MKQTKKLMEENGKALLEKAEEELAEAIGQKDRLIHLALDKRLASKVDSIFLEITHIKDIGPIDQRYHTSMETCKLPILETKYTGAGWNNSHKTIFFDTDSGLFLSKDFGGPIEFKSVYNTKEIFFNYKSSFTYYIPLLYKEIIPERIFTYFSGPWEDRIEELSNPTILRRVLNQYNHRAENFSQIEKSKGLLKEILTHFNSSKK